MFKKLRDENMDQILTFKKLRDEIIGRDFFFKTPYGERLLTYADYTASGRSLKYSRTSFICCL